VPQPVNQLMKDAGEPSIQAYLPRSPVILDSRQYAVVSLQFLIHVMWINKDEFEEAALPNAQNLAEVFDAAKK